MFAVATSARGERFADDRLGYRQHLYSQAVRAHSTSCRYRVLVFDQSGSGTPRVHYRALITMSLIIAARVSNLDAAARYAQACRSTAAAPQRDSVAVRREVRSSTPTPAQRR